MTTIVGSRRDADGNSRSFYDTNTDETLVRLLPVFIDEDFIGAGHASIPAAGSPAAGYPWVQKIVKTTGTPTVAVIANSAGGIVQAALDATNEIQEAALTANDQLNWSMTQGAIFEARVALSVLPGAGVETVFGLQSAWAAGGPDNASYYARFQATGSGAINIQTKDGVTTKSYASGITFAAGAFHIVRIDASDVTNVIFSIDGVAVSTTGQMTFAATGAAAILQPYVSVSKAAATAALGTTQVDMIQISANRV